MARKMIYCACFASVSLSKSSIFQSAFSLRNEASRTGEIKYFDRFHLPSAIQLYFNMV